MIIIVMTEVDAAILNVFKNQSPYWLLKNKYLKCSNVTPFEKGLGSMSAIEFPGVTAPEIT